MCHAMPRLNRWRQSQLTLSVDMVKSFCNEENVLTSVHTGDLRGLARGHVARFDAGSEPLDFTVLKFQLHMYCCLLQEREPACKRESLFRFFLRTPAAERRQVSSSPAGLRFCPEREARTAHLARSAGRACQVVRLICLIKAFA